MECNALNQGEVWCNARGEELRVDQLDQGYAGNILNFLRLRADVIANSYAHWLTFGIPMPVSDAIYHEVEASIEQELDEMTDSATAWLNNKPLLRALQARFDELATARHELAGHL